MDRRITTWGLVLTVCLASAHADTYRVQGRDRSGAPLSGSVVLTASSDEDGETERRIRVVI